MIILWIEAAFRSILVAVVVWAGLKALRVGNVVAQKGVWGLVLAVALLMPFLAPLSSRLQLLPVRATVSLPLPVLTAQRPQTSAVPVVDKIHVAVPTAAYTQGFRSLDAEEPTAKSPDASRSVQPVAPKVIPTTTNASPATLPASLETPKDSPALVRSSIDSAINVSGNPQPAPRQWMPEPARLALGVYLGIAGFLLLRLILGFAAAMSLWLKAQPVSEDVASRFPGELRLRCSTAVSAPVTIGSGVLLPADYARWDAEKLRIVVAHESSHVRQGDFYLQMLAGLYAALVWISPLGWWLKRKLSDLSEAISDRAGLEQAASPSLYAGILLEFAALPRPTPAGVAMARTSNLSHRIERLLNESSFRQAFAGGRRRALVAVLLVPASLFVATTFIRVEAAAKPAAGLSIQTSGVSNPEQADSIPVNQAATPAPSVESAAPAPEPLVAPAPAAAAAPVPPIPPVPAELPTPLSADDLRILIDKTIKISKDIPAGTDIHPNVHVDSKAIHDSVNLALAQGLGSSALLSHGRADGFAYSFSDNGDSYAVINGKGQHLSFSGNWNGDVQKQIDKARQHAHGKFLWFTRNGKSYILENPEIVEQVQKMYLPMEALGLEQEKFARQQEEFAKQEAELGKEMEKASIPTPDLAKEMAELNAAVAKLQASKAKAMTVEQWADLESKIGNLQGKIGAIEGSIGALQGLGGEKMGKLGELQGKLGAEQGKLGEKQGKLAMEADRKIKDLIDEALRDGKAKPVE